MIQCLKYTNKEIQLFVIYELVGGVSGVCLTSFATRDLFEMNQNK